MQWFIMNRRTSGDLDLWIKLDNKNKRKLLHALVTFGYERSELKELESYDFAKHIAFSIGIGPFKIYVMTCVNTASWEDAHSGKVIVAIDAIQIPVNHLNYLILKKLIPIK